MKRSVILSFVAAVPLLATLAFAGHDGECAHGKEGHEPHRGRHGRHGTRFEKQFSKLDLTADQQKKVDAIFEASKKERKERRERFHGEYKKLHEMLEQEKPDENAILAQVDEIGEMKTAEHKAMLKTLIAVRQELTPEQRQKLKEMRSKRGERGEHRRHHDGEKGSKGEDAAPETDPGT